MRELIKLTPYLNVAPRSPTNPHPLPRNKLKKMKVERNKVGLEGTY